MFRVCLPILLLMLATSCAAPAINEPIVANTGSALSNDGYEAAVAAAEAGGYRIVIKDERNAFVRVQSRTSSGVDPSNAVFLDVKAWKGSVDVHITLPQGLALEEPRLGHVLGERQELAWAVGTRARLIAGEPVSAIATDPNTVFPDLKVPAELRPSWPQR